ncbi:c-type cytochrome biogenesis protein CcsB [Nocardioides sp. Y6]|uniref:C-type cytochrome biogenesis protein CcsB n=1 Tax=Nocardioides malaquae TaxID=2773426 RepID=A0ABR9RRS6_9ACTN|nr:c-type cytochrome biogenesis protein CcsB [Nocardioides malaquae]MBE7324277.1 c-type cytochrome biogenesis protein CcsB [Nocardioides malaquae]
MPSTELLAGLSNGFVYAAIAVYVLALLSYAADTARRVATAPARASVPVGTGRASGHDGESVPQLDTSFSRTPALTRFSAIGTSLTVLGWLLSVAALVTRSLAAGRAPWGNMYEFTLASAVAVAVAAAYLFVLTRQPISAFGVWVVSLVLLALGLGITVLYTPADALVPVLNSYWLVIHVAAAIVSGGIFSVGVVATILFLVRSRGERRAGDGDAPLGRYAGGLPRSETLSQVAHAAHMFAFPVWTFAILAGAIWAENSWGRYWGWDPKETWAFITWVLYAAYLHAQSTAGWRGARAAWFAVLGYLAFLFNFFGVNLWITGLHSYAGV